jgi:hypothetical protein
VANISRRKEEPDVEIEDIGFSKPAVETGRKSRKSQS